MSNTRCNSIDCGCQNAALAGARAMTKNQIGFYRLNSKYFACPPNGFFDNFLLRPEFGGSPQEFSLLEEKKFQCCLGFGSNGSSKHPSELRLEILLEIRPRQAQVDWKLLVRRAWILSREVLEIGPTMRRRDKRSCSRKQC